MTGILPYLRALSLPDDADPDQDAGLTEFLRYSSSRLFVSTKMKEAYQWRGVIALWQPIAMNDYLDPGHDECMDKAMYRCIARQICGDLFLAHVLSKFGAGTDDGNYVEEMKLAYLYLGRLLADPPFFASNMDDSLDQELALVSDYNRELAIDTAQQWFDMYSVGLIASTLGLAEGQVATVGRRLTPDFSRFSGVTVSE